MLQRVLTREQVDGQTSALLEARGIRSYRQLTQRPLWDTSQAADVSVDEMSTLITKVSTRLAPRSRTAFDIFLESVNRPVMLRTGLPIVDAALGGGIRLGPLYEVAGVSTIGKTQWAMTLAVECAIEYPSARVLYFDTERGFRAKRLRQITQTRLKRRVASGTRENDAVADVLTRVLVQQVDSLAVFHRCLKELDQYVGDQQIQLIVVDSIASLLVKAHELTFTQREHHMQRIASQLKYMGDVHRAFVVVTNRATTVENEFTSFTKPLLGETWAHCVTTRFVLERHRTFRAVSIVKCPSTDHVVQPFDITELGVEPVQEPTLSHEVFDDDFSIHDDVLRELDLTGLPTVDPSGTLRSTQQSESSAHDVDTIEDDDVTTTKTNPPAILVSDDFVSDSNDESGEEESNGGFSWFRS